MKTILVTGGGGFIGSNLVAALCATRTHRVVVCDRFGDTDKWRNLAHHAVWEVVLPERLASWLGENHASLDMIYSLGAISSTTERNIDLLLGDNFAFPLALWRWCERSGVRFIHTSSAATYGDGSHGFTDDISLNYLESLIPLSGYGWSKHLFDLNIAGSHERKEINLPQWAILKVFNTYGPNEYHKESQRSVICQIAEQAINANVIRIFRSYNKNYPDGGQMRDMLYVKDCISVLLWFLEHPEVSGLFNLGTGQARSFNDMGRAVFAALGREARLHYIDMPDTLVNKYQYFTEASITRLQAAGYNKPFTTLEEGIKDYVTNYMVKTDPYL